MNSFIFHIFNNILSPLLVAQSCPTLVALWTVTYQAPLYMGFSRQGYWSGLPFPSPGDLPDPGIKPRSPALQADALPSKPQGKSSIIFNNMIKKILTRIYKVNTWYIWKNKAYWNIGTSYIFTLIMFIIFVFVYHYLLKLFFSFPINVQYFNHKNRSNKTLTELLWLSRHCA